MPKDVLELGKYLVRELGYEDSVDTLGRWMSHHLAELINNAENANTVHERELIEKSVIETILRIWDHRASLPGTVHPLESYKDVLKMLDLLKPDSNPFSFLWHHDGIKIDQLAATIFDRLIRIIVATLLTKIEPEKRAVEVNSTVFGALNEVEKHILKSLQEWGSLLDVEDKKAKEKGRRDKKDAGSKDVALGEVTLQLIDEIILDLNELRSEIQNTDKYMKI
jgi:hypothetical protein